MDKAHLLLAAREWFETPLVDRTENGDGDLAGWSYQIPGPNGSWVRPSNPGPLYGAAGVGRALLAPIRDQEPMWDRCMLLDMPPIRPPNQDGLDGRS
jgi:hypothetical protein